MVLTFHVAMHIRVLGCSGSIAAGCHTTAFALDDDILIDAGTGVGTLTLDELARIDHIVVSHSHLDHVLAIGLLADSVLRLRAAAGRPPIDVHALPQTIDALRAHIFNGVIWPDFTRLPSPDRPALALRPFAVGDRLAFGDRQIEVLSAAHTVPAVGFAVHGSEGALVYTGDTGPNAALWERLRTMRVRHLVIETAFRDDERALARLTRHLCPSVLVEQLVELDEHADVYITHAKPGELACVMNEIVALGVRHRIRALHAGDRIDIR